MNKKSILDMAMGAIKERVDYEMSSVMDNILDANTDPTAKRKLKLELVFQPDGDRQNIVVTTSVKSMLAPTNAVRTSLYITGNSVTGEVECVEMVPQIPGQIALDAPEQEEPAALNIIKFAQ